MRQILSWRSAFPILIIFLCLPVLKSQQIVIGKVQSENKEILPAATVLLLDSKDSTMISGQVSDTEGNFNFNDINPGTFLVAVSMIGYLDYLSPEFSISAQTPVKNLGIIALKEDNNSLGEVEVSAKKPLFEQKTDRLIVNVANSVSSAGSTALEILQRSPGISVNRQALSILMNGKDGVLVMINNKISRLPISAIVQMLDGMSSQNIERIELIHTPPSSFDAEGNAGIINIILKKNLDEGLNGAFSVNAGYGKKEKAGAGLNFNWRKGKVNFFGDYSWNYNNNPQRFTNYRKVFNDGKTLENFSESIRDPTKTNTQNARVGLDYQLTDKTTIGLLCGWMDRNWTMTALNKTELKENGIVSELIEIPNYEFNHWKHLLGNFNLQHQFGEGQSLNFDVDYAAYNQANPSNYTNRYFDPAGTLTAEDAVRIQKNTPINILTFKADYNRPLGKKMQLESGVKAAFSSFDNNILVEEEMGGLWTEVPEYSALYNLNEDILAAYSAVTFKINDKTDLKGGLRYEYTDTNLSSNEQADIVDRKYGKLFPSLFFSRKINKDNQLNLSYSRRIQRPDFTQLAPFVIFTDPTTLLTGNTALQPSITDAVMAAWQWKSYRISVQYSYEDQAIRWIPQIDPTNNKQLNRTDNIDFAKSIGTTLSAPFHPTAWWDMQYNLTVQWESSSTIYNGNQLLINQFNWNINGSQNFKFPHNFTFEISGYYYPTSVFGVLISKPFGKLNLGLQKEFAKNQGSLRFSVSDLFLSGNWAGTVNQPDLNLVSELLFGFSERVFRLTYSRNFGSSKVKGNRQRETGSEDERNRVKNQ